MGTFPQLGVVGGEIFTKHKKNYDLHLLVYIIPDVRVMLASHWSGVDVIVSVSCTSL